MGDLTHLLGAVVAGILVLLSLAASGLRCFKELVGTLDKWKALCPQAI